MSAGVYGTLNPDHEKYQSVLKQFNDSWRHPTNVKLRPSRVVRILGITCPWTVREAYVKYKAALETRGKFSTRGMDAGNERRRWHGTICRGCKFLNDNLADRGNCDDDVSKCIICSIINTGFRKPQPTTPSNQRFGFGVYLSATSSKSDDYTGDRINNMAHAAQGRKLLILCKVAVGRGCKLNGPSMYLVNAPQGFDSVIGDPAVYQDLRYDEIVMYNKAGYCPHTWSSTNDRSNTACPRGLYSWYAACIPEGHKNSYTGCIQVSSENLIAFSRFMSTAGPERGAAKVADETSESCQVQSTNFLALNPG
ncbi:putative adp-ribosylation [Lyophyllum shimeji]|uniref:Adp-ribosylation n=1 Tax=Lyophyllum shimeji TaxID=47721 RepID=A0A9P3PPC3_LYOSH|nr:putative adp-ribosylation [Lyophyllum shimeji]